MNKQFVGVFVSVIVTTGILCVLLVLLMLKKYDSENIPVQSNLHPAPYLQADETTKPVKVYLPPATFDVKMVSGHVDKFPQMDRIVITYALERPYRAGVIDGHALVGGQLEHAWRVEMSRMEWEEVRFGGVGNTLEDAIEGVAADFERFKRKMCGYDAEAN